MNILRRWYPAGSVYVYWQSESFDADGSDYTAAGLSPAWSELSGDVEIVRTTSGTAGPTGPTGPTGPQGELGPQGDSGPQGNPGPQGEEGPPGADGLDGIDGASAYAIAVANGFEGDEAAWLASLEALWNFRGAYGGGDSYAIGDVATYGGETWYRTHANGGNVGDPPSTSSPFWTLLAQKGDPASGPAPSNTTPQAIGTASAGTSAEYSRADHVHAAALSALSDVTAPSPATQQVLKWGGSAWSPSPVDPYSVGPAGSGAAYTVVQDAVNAADAAGGGVVTLLPGSYAGDVSLKNGVWLQGAGRFDRGSTIVGSVTANIGVSGGTRSQTLTGIADVLISVSSGTGIAVSGSHPQEVRVRDVYIFASSSATAMSISNGASDGTLISLVTLEGVKIQGIGSTTPLQHSAGLLEIRGRVDVSAATGNATAIAWSGSSLVYTTTGALYVTGLITSASAGSIVATSLLQATAGGAAITHTGTGSFALGQYGIVSPTPSSTTIVQGTGPVIYSPTSFAVAPGGYVGSLIANSIALQTRSGSSAITALQATSPSAGKLAYFTGAETASLTDITTAGREIISTASSGAAGQVLTSTGSGSAPTWTTPSSGTGSPGHYGVFYDSTSQSIATANTPKSFQFNTLVEGSGITVENNEETTPRPTKITAQFAGTYNIQLSVQLDNSTSQVHDADIWFRLDGVDVLDSNSQISVPNQRGGNSGNALPAFNFVLTLEAGQYVEIMWAVENVNITAPYYGPWTTPTNPYNRPSTPSIILSVTQVMEVQEGPQGPQGPAGADATLGTTLQLIDGATVTNNSFVWFPTSSTISVDSVGTTGLDVLASSTAADARTALELGTAATQDSTAFQAANSNLTAITSVTPSANKLVYYTGATTADTTDITTAGKEILSTTSSGTSGQYLTSSGGGSTPTWTTASPYAADAWDVSWQYSVDGDPSAAGWTLTGTNAAASTAVPLEYSGSVLSATTNGFTVSGTPFIASDFGGAIVEITGGTGSGQIYSIASNTTSAITIIGSWATPPDGTSSYKITTANRTASCWQIGTTASAAASMSRVVPSAYQTRGAWELRARVLLPNCGGGTNQFFSYVRYTNLIGTTNANLRIAIPSAGGAGLLTGATLGSFVYFTGSGAVPNGPLMDNSWVTFTLRCATTPMEGAAAPNQAAYSLWVGEQFQGTLIGNTAQMNAGGTPFEIAVGKTVYATSRPVYVDYIKWRRGFNDAPPTHTFRGGGYDQP